MCDYVLTDVILYRSKSMLGACINLNLFVMELIGLTIGHMTPRGNVRIQSDISAELRRGEFTCLLGPNGAGKTTMLRTLSGFIPPLEGSILIDGRNIASYKQSELASKIGVVLTERPSVSSMTVVQLVSLGRSPYTGFWGRLTDRDRQVTEEAMELTGIGGLRDRLVDTLSDGERARVMVAKALAQETPVIFLDEPTAFLDFPGKAEMMRLLRSLAHEQDKTIFQSTHDLNMALALADRIWLADRRLGVRVGTPRELADDGSLQRYFLRPGIAFDPEALEFRVETS